MSKKLLATKLHDSLCPKCNGQCHINSLCVFVHQPSDDSIWETNDANRYFLKLAEKATAIMAETFISEEEFFEYAKQLSSATDQIPDNVITSMKSHDWR